MWTIKTLLQQSPSADVTAYRFYRDGAFIGEVPKPASGEVPFTYEIPEPETTVVLEASAVDAAGNESPKVSKTLPLDRLAPAAPGGFSIVSVVWVPRAGA